MGYNDYYNIISINGTSVIRVIYNEETGLYHWNGDASYSGYTEEECILYSVDNKREDI